jgi:cold shock protein
VIGRILSYDPRRGAGEIAPEDGAENIFFHVSELERAGIARAVAGERVTFDVKIDHALGRRFAVNLSQA